MDEVPGVVPSWRLMIIPIDGLWPVSDQQSICPLQTTERAQRCGHRGAEIELISSSHPYMRYGPRQLLLQRLILRYFFRLRNLHLNPRIILIQPFEQNASLTQRLRIQVPTLLTLSHRLFLRRLPRLFDIPFPLFLAFLSSRFRLRR